MSIFQRVRQIIDTLTGQKTRAAKSLKSCADGVSAHRVLDHEKYGNKLVLVDTPGFDATHKTDKQILEMISKWMTKTYASFLDLPRKTTIAKRKNIISSIIQIQTTDNFNSNFLRPPHHRYSGVRDCSP
jgi:predicted GTPase